MSAAELWKTLWVAGADLAGDLGLEEPPAIFTPSRALPAVDAWLHDAEPLDENDAARLCGVLFRVLVETHGGGLRVIDDKKHPLDGEWVLGAFERGLDADYFVPIVVSAVRIGVDRSLSAVDWYTALVKEGASSRR